MWPDRRFYTDVASTLKQGLLSPDFYKGFAKEATIGLLGAPGDIGYIAGNAPAFVRNWREGLPLTQDMGSPHDYAFTSESLADTFGVPFNNTGPEMAGRALGGVLDIGALGGLLKHTARGLPPGLLDTGPIGRQKGIFGGAKGAENLATAGNDAPMQALRAAEMADYRGATPDDIWRMTGEQFGYPVYRDQPGNYLFEMDDSAVKGIDYQLTPAEAFDKASSVAIVRDDPRLYEIASEMAPYKDWSLDELKAEYTRTGDIIAETAKTDMAQAKALMQERRGLDAIFDNMRNDYAPMSKYLDHPELQQAYPDIADIHTRINPDELGPNTRGQYLSGTDYQGPQIHLAESPVYSPEGKSTALHEWMHPIQRAEGIPQGGSPASMTEAYDSLRARLNFLESEPDYIEADKQIDTLFDSLMKEEITEEQFTAARDAIENSMPSYREAIKTTRQLGVQKMGGYEGYRRLAGEEQARAVQKRMNLSQAERIDRPVWADFDTPMDEQIVRYGDGPALATAWHGSPHRINNVTDEFPMGRFDMSKVGTGEGAQAYGHGLYFAEDPGVAGSYRDKLTGRGAYSVDGEPVMESYVAHHPDAYGIAATDGDAGLRERLTAMDEIVERTRAAGQEPGIDFWDEYDITEGLLGKKVEADAGHLYKVDIPDESIDNMLDWDAPLSEQPAALKKLRKRVGNSSLDGLVPPLRDALQDFELKNTTGKTIYGILDNYFEGDRTRVSSILNKLDIPGIKYWDGGSRGAGEGTRNFVVFDDKLPTILERNGETAAGLLGKADDLPMDEASRLRVGEDVPNMESIGATFTDYEVVPGIQTVQMSDFDVTSPSDLFYAADDVRRTRKLADEIAQNQRIDPLIVVEDAEGKYILEGAHRLGALHELGEKSFPAVVVRDLENL